MTNKDKNGILFPHILAAGALWCAIWPMGWSADVTGINIADTSGNYDGTVEIERDGSDNMTFKDGIVTVAKPLAAFVGGSGLGFLTVASSTATHKAAADYECDGTADDVQIQEAIDAMPNGGTVMLSEGIFNLAASVDIKDLISIKGTGPNATTLKTTAADTPALEINPASGTYQNIEISGIYFDSTTQTASTTAGGGIYNNTGHNINNLWIHNNRFSSANANNHGIYFNNTAGTRDFIWIYDNVFTVTAASHCVGFNAPGSNIFIRDNQVNYNAAAAGATNGLTFWEDAREIVIQGNRIVSINDNAIELGTASNVQILGNDIDPGATAGDSAIMIRWNNALGGSSTSEQITIVGNVIHDGADGISIDRDDTDQPAPNHIIITANAFQAMTKGIDASAADNVLVFGNSFDTVTTPWTGGTVTFQNMNIRSSIATLDVAGVSTLAGTLDVAGVSTLDGNVYLGDASTDFVTVTGKIDADFLPYASANPVLGNTLNRWESSYIDDMSGGSLTLTGDSTLGNGVADTATNNGEARGWPVVFTGGDDTNVWPAYVVTSLYLDGYVMGDTIGFQTLRDGSITGLAFRADCEHCYNYGIQSIDLYVNASEVLSIAFAASSACPALGIVNYRTTQARGTDTFSAGDILHIKIDSTAGGIHLDDYNYQIEVIYD